MKSILPNTTKNYTPVSLIKEATSLLEQVGIESPQIECEILLGDILGIKNRINLYLNRDKLSLTNMDSFNRRLNMRVRGYPIQYITQKAYFMDFELIVNPSVFIPRPETEILVEKILGINQTNSQLEILDIGTGSGNIAISLAKYIPQTKVTAIDISDRILKIAQRNAKLNKVDRKIEFLKIDILKLLNQSKNIFLKKFNIVVSNPPYIPSNKLHLLQSEVKFEPEIALDGGNDGLKFYKKIINNIEKILTPEGFLVLEIGEGQSSKITQLLGKSKLKLIGITKDYSGIDRVITSQLVNTSVSGSRFAQTDTRPPKTEN